MDRFRRMLRVGCQHSADHIPVSALQFVTRGGLGPRAELRRTGFVIPSETFCATAGLWSVDITFGSGLQIPTRVSSKGGTMDGFRRMLWICRQHSADHIPVSALHSAGWDLPSRP